MQAVDFLHCDHVIKIQCRKSTPCRISFAAVCDLVTFHPCLCKSCIREIFLSSINKNKKYWCFVLPWFSMSMEIEAHQQSSLQWGYKVSWLSICWTWIPHLQNSKVRRRPVWVVLGLTCSKMCLKMSDQAFFINFWWFFRHNSLQVVWTALDHKYVSKHVKIQLYC